MFGVRSEFILIRYTAIWWGDSGGIGTGVGDGGSISTGVGDGGGIGRGVGDVSLEKEVLMTVEMKETTTKAMFLTIK